MLIFQDSLKKLSCNSFHCTVDCSLTDKAFNKKNNLLFCAKSKIVSNIILISAPCYMS